MNPYWLYTQLIRLGYPPQQVQMAMQQYMQTQQGGASGMGGLFGSGMTGLGTPAGAPLTGPYSFGSGGSPNPSGAGGDAGGMGDILSQLAMLFAGKQGINTLQQPWNLQMDAAKTGMNPALLNQRIQAMTKPLSHQLVQSVTRATTPGIAEAGLATSPGMSQQMIGEALAPYQLQEQQLGQQAAFQGMDMPFKVGSGAAGGYPSAGVDLVELMRMMGSQGYQ